MKTLEDCLDEITDESYAISQTLLEFVDEDVQESLLRSIYNSYKLKDYASVGIFGRSLAQAIDEALEYRAEKSLEDYKRKQPPVHSAELGEQWSDHKKYEAVA